MVQSLFSIFGLAWFTATTRLDTPKCDHSICLLSHVLYTVAMDKILTVKNFDESDWGKI